MAPLLLLLLLAPPPAEQTAAVAAYLKAGKKAEAVAVLKKMAKLEGNDAEAKALVKLIRKMRVDREPEVVEEAFLALRGMKSRKATRSLLALLRHSTLKKQSAIRVGVCRALSGSADPAGVETILDLLRDNDDHVVAAAAAAAGAYRYEKDAIRKDLFKTILNVYESTWNLKNSVKPELKTEKRRAERKWEIIEKPAEKSLQLLSNVTQKSPPAWRRWWNKHKKKRWEALDN